MLICDTAACAFRQFVWKPNDKLFTARALSALRNGQIFAGKDLRSEGSKATGKRRQHVLGQKADCGHYASPVSTGLLKETQHEDEC